MPWSKDNLPPSVKNKNWSAHQVEVFVKAANAALEEYGDDGKAIATGTAAAEHEKTNASQKPKHYYCRHMQPGVCKYNSEVVLVDTDAIKRMIGGDVIGQPVYVLHNTAPNDERLKNLQEEADGYITDSFYNELDGWAWFEFIVVSDKGHAAVAKGWAVSNAYMPTEWGPGGTKNNVPYDREIVNGAFTHLAIVPDPRYEDARIMTPEQFRLYQDSKKRELVELQNSKTEPSGGKKMFKLFKTKREEVSAIDADTQVELENGKTVSVGEMLNAMKKNSEDEEKAKAEKEKKEKENSEKINGDSMVECEGEKMPLKELVNKYNAAMKANAEADEKKNADEKAEKEKKEKEEKENAEQKNREKDAEEEKANSHFLELQNAAGIKPTTNFIQETGMDRTARGKARYGSVKAA